MNKKIYDYYEAQHLLGSGGLAETSERIREIESETSESIREIEWKIDKSNEHIIELGYKPVQYRVTRVHGSRNYTEGGEFISSIEQKTAIEIYPDEQ